MRLAAYLYVGLRYVNFLANSWPCASLHPFIGEQELGLQLFDCACLVTVFVATGVRSHSPSSIDASGLQTDRTVWMSEATPFLLMTERF